MNLKEEYKKETGLDVYILDKFSGEYRNLDYVNWLEAKINYLHSSTQLPTSKQLISDCRTRFESFEVRNKFDYRSYLNGYLDSFSKYVISKSKR